MRRIIVDERAIRWGKVKLLEPQRSDREMMGWWHWVGYVRTLPCVDFQPLPAAQLENEHARRLDTALMRWLESGGTYDEWWTAVNAANQYLLKAVQQ